MVELIFKRKSRTLSVPMADGVHSFEAFSEVRNELNGDRPDPSRLPDVERGVAKDLSLGPPVMPRPFPLGTWSIYATEDTNNEWMEPAKIKTDANQLVPVYQLRADGTYGDASGGQFSDWGYWIHYANGSQHTDGCIGVVSLDDFKQILNAVKNCLDSGIPICVTAVDE